MANQSEPVLFWREYETNGYLSQWFLAPMMHNGIVYNCCEQWMMASKAKQFNDEQSLQQIMAELDPAKQKKLGRQVKNFDAAKWNSVSREVVFQGNLFKFQQHDQLRNLLLKTENSLLVEASPFDKIWGIGLGPDDPRAKSPEQWQGTNWLGEELMRVRDSGTLYEI